MALTLPFRRRAATTGFFDRPSASLMDRFAGPALGLAALGVTAFAASALLSGRATGWRSAIGAGKSSEAGPSIDGGKDHASPAAALEDGRGRDAERPDHIPAKGWKDILWRVYEEFGQDRIMLIAAGVTYYALLAIFPAIAALVSTYGLFADPATMQEHMQTLSGILPGGALDILNEQVKRLAAQGDAALGIGFVIGLGISIWSANAGIKAIFDALNIAYDEVEKRGFVALNVQSLMFTVAIVAFLLLALGGIVVLPIALEFIGLGAATEWLISLARWPILLGVVMFGLAFLYRNGPSRAEAKWRWVTPGSAVAAVLWLGVSMLFSWYVANFGDYNATYGSLGAVIGFMTWIWLSTVIILLGAEINAEIEHQTARDTTTGAPAPLGARGAEMADKIGAARA